MQRKRHPALIVSYTKIDGGLIVLLAPYHYVMDGGGRELLFDLWARNTRQLSNSKGGDEEIVVTEALLGSDEPLTRNKRLKQAVVSAVTSDGLTSAPNKFTIENSTITSIYDSKSKLPPPSAPPPPAQRKLFRFSVTMLSELRTSLRSHTCQPNFTLNTILTALLWQIISSIRLARLKHNSSGSESELDKLVSELIMAVNPRSGFYSKGLLEKDSWLGNLAIPMIPKPTLAFSKLGTAQELDDGSLNIPISSILPKVIDEITDGIRNMSPQTVAKYVLETESGIPLNPASTTVSASSFSYRSLRDMRALFNGLSFTVTAWSNFKFYPDFGPDVGRPEFLRVAGQGASDGVSIFLPRKRESDGWDVAEVDAFEVVLSLREDDMKVFQENEIVKALLLETKLEPFPSPDDALEGSIPKNSGEGPTLRFRLAPKFLWQSY